MPCWAGAGLEYGIPIGKKSCYTPQNNLRIWLRSEAGAKQARATQRCLRPLRCAFFTLTTSLTGTQGAFRVGAPPLLFG